jgi:hypothetical protein
MIKTQHQAFEYIWKRSIVSEADNVQQIKYVQELLCKDVFPHLGITESDFERKSAFLGYI